MHAANEAPRSFPLTAGVGVVINLRLRAPKRWNPFRSHKAHRHAGAPSPVVRTRRRGAWPESVLLEAAEDLRQQLDRSRLIGHPRPWDQIPALDLRSHQESGVTRRQPSHQGSEEGRDLALCLNEQISVVADHETPTH